MSSFEWPDLSCLASLARTQNLDVRPVLLRVHTDLFIAAPSRDRATVEAFEALALGFLPTVDDATSVIVAQKLASVADTPPKIIDALIRRGGETRDAILAGLRSDAGQAKTTPSRDRLLSTFIASRRDLDGDSIDQLLALKDDAIDLALARNHDAPLAPSHLDALLERARERRDLGLALLERKSLGPADEAVLYLHAGDARRSEIRSRLEPMVAIAGRTPSITRASERTVETLFELASQRDAHAFGTELALMLNLPPTPDWRFHLEARHELLALALVAAGVAEEDCVRIFLTLDEGMARSVETVFNLARTAREVPRPLATYLVEAILGETVEMQRPARYLPTADPSGAPARGFATWRVPGRTADAGQKQAMRA